MTVTYKFDNERAGPAYDGDASSAVFPEDETHDGANLQGECIESKLVFLQSDTDPDSGKTINPRAGSWMQRLNIKFDDDWDYAKDGSGSCIDRPRIQLRKRNASIPNGKFALDTEYWVGVSMYLPAGHVFDSKQENLLEICQPSWNGIIMRTDQGEWKVINQYGEDGGGFADNLYGADYLNDREQWIDWAFNIIFSGNNGKVVVYKNKVEVGRREGVITYDSSVNDNPDIRCSKLYKPGWRNGATENNERIVYYDELRMSDTVGGAGLDEVSPDSGAGSLIANNDSYSVNAGQTLVVSAPGVMENDTF